MTSGRGWVPRRAFAAAAVVAALYDAAENIA
jgi:hypothetical protein